MSTGAYRDAGAAVERAEALEREVEELKEEIARLRDEARRAAKQSTRPPPDVERLQSELVDLRAENELVRSQLKNDGDGDRNLRDLRSRLAAGDAERRELEARLRTVEESLAAATAQAKSDRDGSAKTIAALRAEIDRLESLQRAQRERPNAPPPPPAPPPRDPPAPDERDAIIARMRDEAKRSHEEIVDLRTQNELLRSAIAKLEEG